MKLLSIVLFLIVAVCIILVAILINPEQIQNQYFWITVGWLIVLSALNWIASTFVFIGASGSNSNSRTYGILPPLNILVFIYSLFSGVLLISTWYINDFGILPNWHLISQLILFAIASSLSVLMFMASKAAKVDDANVQLNKEDLIKVLQLIHTHKDLSNEKKELIKELIAIVRYSIPHLSKLKSIDNYNKLTSSYTNMDTENYSNIKISDIEKSIYLAKNC